ncbi:MAG TPA: hypothetical protein VGS17_11735 [Candidatus Limnocylindria bacterium]|nr:hypothetical protein [Candidatus Limnocylindria bacterium]
MKRLVPAFVAAALALATFGSIAVLGRSSAAPSTVTATEPTPAPTGSPEPPEAADPTNPAVPELAETADPTPEATQPAGTADVGHADDPADPNANHEFDGQE